MGGRWKLNGSKWKVDGRSSAIGRRGVTSDCDGLTKTLYSRSRLPAWSVGPWKLSDTPIRSASARMAPRSSPDGSQEGAMRGK